MYPIEKILNGFEKKYSKEAIERLRSKLNLPNVGFQGELHEFQQEGVNYLLEEKRAILGDDQGTGKTIQALVTVEKANDYPCLIVCKKNLIFQWVREIQRFFPTRMVSVWDLTHLEKYKIADSEITSFNFSSDFVVLPESQLWKQKEIIERQGFKTLILDEGHEYKNPKTLRSKAALSISKKIPRVLILTGTLVKNRKEDIAHPLRILGKKEKDIQNLVSLDSGQEIGEILREDGFLRRNKAEVLPYLPPKKRHTLNALLTQNSKKAYQEAKKRFIEFLREESIQELNQIYELEGLPEEERKVEVAFQSLEKISVLGDKKRAEIEKKLSQMDEKEKITYLNNTFQHILKQSKHFEHLKQYNALRMIAALGKIEYCKAWILRFLEITGRKLVVFIKHKKVMDALMNDFSSIAVKIDGRVTSSIKREQAKEAFNTDPKVRLIFISISAGKEGLNLAKGANDVLFVELDWSASDHNQAEDRIHRIGQEASVVNCWYLIASGTIEEDIARLIEQKRELLRTILDLGNREESEIIKLTKGDIQKDAIEEFIAREIGESKSWVQ